MMGKLAIAMLTLGLAPYSLEAAIAGPLRAEVQVPVAGSYELVLPAPLHRLAPEGGLDVQLLGPDGQPRAFELYWVRGGGESTHDLAPESYSFRSGAFVWEAALPAAGSLKRIEIHAAQADFSGTLQVELLGPRRLLASDRALFSGQPVRVELDQPMAGRRLRLSLKGMDPRFRAAARLLGDVRVDLQRGGQAPATVDIELGTVAREMDIDGRRIEEHAAVLPGSGLRLLRLDIGTRNALIGAWRLGRESLIDGRTGFVQHSEGQQQGLSSSARDLILAVDTHWPGRDLRLRLENRGGATGLRSLRARLQLPRIAFAADSPGAYSLAVGTGQQQAVAETAVVEGLLKPLVAGSVRSDPHWRPELLLQRFALQGAPFESQGYAWHAPVAVPSAGYWRLQLPDQTNLDGDLQGLRLVANGVQVPSFLLPDGSRSLSLTPQAESLSGNRSRWTLVLPQPSEAWSRVSLLAEGVFSRRVLLEWRRAQAPVWQPLATLEWSSRGGVSSLDLPLGAWVRESAELRVSMDHGDNRPLALKGAQAAFEAEALAFISAVPQDLQLWGGKESAAPARYDLELLRQELTGLQASPLQAGAREIAPVAPWYLFWSGMKAGSQAWFYAALGLVTLVLLLVIAKLLPRA